MEKKKIIFMAVSVLILGFVAGFFAGREYLKYEIRSAFVSAFSGAGEGIFKNLAGTGQQKGEIKSKAVEAQSNQEKEAYIKDYIELYNVTSRYTQDFIDGKVPVVFGKIKNKGNRSLKKVIVTAYFQDAAGNVIHENSYPAVLTGGMNDEKPLKPKYIKEFGFKSKNCPSEWKTGKVNVSITDIEFE